MARSFLTILEQKVEISDTVKMIITEIEQEVDGDYVREYRVTATGQEGETSNPQVFILRLKSPIRANLEFVAPSVVIL